jgi:hypothetical protein
MRVGKNPQGRAFLRKEIGLRKGIFFVNSQENKDALADPAGTFAVDRNNAMLDALKDDFHGYSKNLNPMRMPMPLMSLRAKSPLLFALVFVSAH